MPRCVLNIDDEAGTCRMLSTALEEFGFETASAFSRLEALDMMNKFKPEAIVLDLMMPGIDGFEVARRVRANPKPNLYQSLSSQRWGGKCRTTCSRSRCDGIYE